MGIDVLQQEIPYRLDVRGAFTAGYFSLNLATAFE
jgi:hypothetical protein